MELFQTLKAPTRLPSRSLSNTLAPWFVCLFVFTTLGFKYWQGTLYAQGATERMPHLAFLWTNASLAMKHLLKERPGWGSYILKPPWVRGQVDPGLNRKKEQEANYGDGFQAKVEAKKWEWSKRALTAYYRRRTPWMLQDAFISRPTPYIYVFHDPCHIDMHFIIPHHTDNL